MCGGRSVRPASRRTPLSGRVPHGPRCQDPLSEATSTRTRCQRPRPRPDPMSEAACTDLAVRGRVHARTPDVRGRVHADPMSRPRPPETPLSEAASRGPDVRGRVRVDLAVRKRVHADPLSEATSLGPAVREPVHWPQQRFLLLPSHKVETNGEKVFSFFICTYIFGCTGP